MAILDWIKKILGMNVEKDFQEIVLEAEKIVEDSEKIVADTKLEDIVSDTENVLIDADALIKTTEQTISDVKESVNSQSLPESKELVSKKIARILRVLADELDK